MQTCEIVTREPQNVTKKFLRYLVLILFHPATMIRIAILGGYLTSITATKESVKSAFHMLEVACPGHDVSQARDAIRFE